jgi:hypothetical protein
MCSYAFVHTSVCVRSECRTRVHACAYLRNIDFKGRYETFRSCLYHLLQAAAAACSEACVYAGSCFLLL